MRLTIPIMIAITTTALINLSLLVSCAQGGEPQYQRSLEFAGRPWLVRNSDQLVGPGPNFFSDEPSQVWVDDQGHLHMSIKPQDGQWRCSQLRSDWPVGYGVYEFHLAGGADQFDPNVVIGLYTWDSNTSKTDANSEIDIEITRWSRTDEQAPNLYYTVHPGWGPDGKHEERADKLLMSLDGESSTHIITWHPDRITCASYRGDLPDPDNLIAEWVFDDTNPPRVKKISEDQTTDPVLIPRPSPTTHIQMNLWLHSVPHVQGVPPTDGKPVEMIVTGFRYTPAEQAEIPEP